uniref:C-type lectin domain-containing protein n=1 Tax=Panagrolaimus sp. ES5 TaxID=591445 RepID=A0AC34FIB5_9BILA
MIAQIFVLFCCAQIVSSACPSESFGWQDYCLFFNSTPANFGDAELSCQRVHGRLASVHDAFYNSVLSQNALAQFQNSTSNSSDFWIGATKYTWDESWIWDDGTPLNYTDWRRGEPNNSTGNDCAAASWIDGYWSAQKSSALKPFVCELPKRLFTTTTLPATTNAGGYPSAFSCPQGWIYYPPTGSCYFAVVTAQTWTNSEIRCQSFGSDLASIHSDAEFYFLFRRL